MSNSSNDIPPTEHDAPDRGQLSNENPAPSSSYNHPPIVRSSVIKCSGSSAPSSSSIIEQLLADKPPGGAPQFGSEATDQQKSRKRASGSFGQTYEKSNAIPPTEHDAPDRGQLSNENPAPSSSYNHPPIVRSSVIKCSGSSAPSSSLNSNSSSISHRLLAEESSTTSAPSDVYVRLPPPVDVRWLKPIFPKATVLIALNVQHAMLETYLRDKNVDKKALFCVKWGVSEANVTHFFKLFNGNDALSGDSRDDKYCMYCSVVTDNMLVHVAKSSHIAQIERYFRLRSIVKLKTSDLAVVSCLDGDVQMAIRWSVGRYELYPGGLGYE
uniref:C2H2-type domain-containing protein n=1 Tax=Panagrellus redivivus TaxID=6233 RepID=A0A7E4ZY35_PANRE